ncbi:MAG: ATP-binding protein [Gammaproteobacteria bacterium]
MSGVEKLEYVESADRVVGNTAILTPTRAIAALIGALGLSVLCGWEFDIPHLKAFAPAAIEMKANTALALVFAALSLAVLDSRPPPHRQRAAQLLAILVSAIGVATLLEYLIGREIGIHEAFVGDTGDALNPIHGGMGPVAAIAFVIIGCALAALPRPGLRLWVLAGAAASVCIGTVTLLGYLWKATEPTTDSWLPPVAMPSAAAFILLGIGVMMANRARHPGLPDAGHGDGINGVVEAKVLAGFIGSVVLLCLGGGVTYRMGVDFANSAQLVIKSQQVRAALSKLYESIADAESVQRNYLLIGTLAYREEYGRLTGRVDSNAAALRDLIASDAVQRAQLDKLLPVIRGRMNALSNHIEIFERRGEQAARSAIATDDGVRSMVQIRTRIGQMDDIEQHVLNARADTLGRHRSYSLIALLMTVAVATVLLIVLFGSIVRDIRERARITRALESAQLRARQATSAKSDFLAAMSHEIRTPMNGVIGMLDVLGESSLKSAQVDMVRLIRESANGLLRIIDDILDFSKIEAGRLEIEKVPMSVADVVEGTGGLLNRLARRKGATLAVFVDPRIPAALLGDAMRLRQVLVNLTSNAIKFSSGLKRAGEVSVRAELIERHANEAVVEFRITDNGIGMDEATLARLFTSFTQADASTTRRYGGTGLGLAISKQLIGLMSGEIAVRTQVNAGSVFTVRLTFALAKPLPVAAPVPAVIAGLHCVVVGGQGSLADDLAIYLAADGAQVERMPDLPSTWNRARSELRGTTVWVVDAGKATATPDDAASVTRIRTDEMNDVALVRVTRGRGRIPRAEADGVVVVDGNALKRRTLCKAVAIAAGREVPEAEVSACVSGKVATAPPTRKAAIREKRLVLLVEDNDMNQNVIRRQLHLLGYQVDVASDGREGLQRWQSGDYALVLADLHMPEMDGYGLAAAIREAEQGGSHTPLIALTANALSSEAERCREAGMDDYLRKPATLGQLAEVLEKWLPARARGVRTAAAPPPALDKAVLESLVGASPRVVNEFLQQFSLTAARLGAELVCACASRRPGDAAAIAHKLKSSARSVGALALGDLCESIETAGHHGDAAALVELRRQFETEIAAVEACLCTLKTSAPNVGRSAGGAR